jgi:serine/threonine protein phosphatase PrpC
MANDDPGPPVRYRVTAAGKTDVGRVRDHNEDRLRLSPELDLFVVADGMGGHNAGEVASALAALSLENCFKASRTEPLPGALADDPRPLTDDARSLLAAARKANADVFEISSTHAEHSGMGTTLVAIHVARASGEVHIVHVGDSRCYRVRDGGIEQLTRDHSLVGDALAWKPNLTEKELALLPKNIISRALGRAPAVEVDVRTEPLRPGDVYLLCSDGLSGMVDDDAILGCIEAAREPSEICEALISRANAAGGGDNVTAVVVRADVEDSA